MLTETVATFVKQNKAKGFRAEARYFDDGDFVTYFAKNDLYHAVRWSEVVTAYISEVSGELIGCKIKGVAALWKELGDFHVVCSDGKAKIGPLLLAASMADGKKEKEKIVAMNRQFGAETVDLSALGQAA